jgi:hypothetical protein
MITIQEKSFTVGKYLVSPLTRDAGATGFTAAVSIRSGSGRAMHDRVFRFTPLFPSRESACRYAAREGASWALHTARA